VRPLATAVFLVASAALCLAQVVPVSKEPHHRTVYEDAHLRVLDVVIPPGVTTLEHSHDLDLITVSIGQADTRTRAPGEDWGSVRPRRPLGDASVVEYAGKRGIHTIQNVGRDPYHLLAVENVKQSGWRPAPAVAVPNLRPLVEGRAFRASALRLSGNQRVTRVHTGPAVVVLVSGEALLASAGHRSRRLSAAARWGVVAAGRAFALSAAGSGSAEVVEVEVW
jgi:hypothetical protein